MIFESKRKLATQELNSKDDREEKLQSLFDESYKQNGFSSYTNYFIIVFITFISFIIGFLIYKITPILLNSLMIGLGVLGVLSVIWLTVIISSTNNRERRISGYLITHNKKQYEQILKILKTERANEIIESYNDRRVIHNHYGKYSKSQKNIPVNEELMYARLSFGESEVYIDY